jgi:inosine-uridine nucleoside N-ribohydrolase
MRSFLVLLMVAGCQRDPLPSAPPSSDPSRDRPGAPARKEGREKLILDTDIGTDIDDAWAVAFVGRHPRFEVLGITISDGETARRAKVACKLLHAMGRDDIPVAVGRATPVPPERIDHQFAWAEDFIVVKPVETPAARFIAAAIRRHPGQVTLLAVGPLQNVADAIRLDPGIVKQVRRVVLMSGNIYSSAWSPTPIAEWNVKASTPDSQLVYASGLPLTIVPVDTTSWIQLEDAERERVRAARTPLANSLEQLYRLWIDAPATRMTLHDQLAVAEAARPGKYFDKMERLQLRVDDEGLTRIDPKNGKPVQVAFKARRAEFMDFYLSTISR